MAEIKARVQGERCKGCGICITNCPKKAISHSGKFNSQGYDVVAVDEEACIGCGICYTVCPDCVFEIV